MPAKESAVVTWLKLAAIVMLLPLAGPAGCKGGWLYKSCGGFYTPGRLTVQVVSLAAHEYGNPVPMDIYTPQESFRYPVVIFQHGFTGSIKNYETVLNHLASHGFVVVAPQMYPADGSAGWPTYAEEAALGLEVISWVQDNITSVITVEADPALLGIAGHSRGGQIAYRMAIQLPDAVKALAGVDPVDGPTPDLQAVTEPLDFTIPTYILGTGLGPEFVDNTTAACAPAARGYQHFYPFNPHPSWLAVATENGHADMLDESDLCPVEPACATGCPGGPDRDGMRSFTAGTLAAFFSGTLQSNRLALALLMKPGKAPVPCTMEKK